MGSLVGRFIAAAGALREVVRRYRDRSFLAAGLDGLAQPPGFAKDNFISLAVRVFGEMVPLAV